LLTDTEGREAVQERKRRFLVGSTVVQPEQDMAVEIDEAHAEGWRV
jgi:hypothetical protein